MANGHDDTLMKRVPSYGTGDPGKIGFLPMMAMVAVKVLKVHQTAGGLELPESAQSQYQTPKCEVLAVGPQVLFLKVGDMVRAKAEMIADKMWVGDATWILVREDQFFGVDLDSENSPFVREAARNKLADAVGKKIIIAPEG